MRLAVVEVPGRSSWGRRSLAKLVRVSSFGVDDFPVNSVDVDFRDRSLRQFWHNLLRADCCLEVGSLVLGVQFVVVPGVSIPVIG
eukprot:11201499-Lingulodinium_polyedra.AAC.1